jgi:hypothetical protein
MSHFDLEGILSEAAALQVLPDSPEERREYCGRIGRVYKQLRRAACFYLQKIKLDLQSGAPLDRDRMVEVLTGCEMVIQGSCDATIQTAQIAKDEIQRGGVR